MIMTKNWFYRNARNFQVFTNWQGTHTAQLEFCLAIQQSKDHIVAFLKTGGHKKILWIVVLMDLTIFYAS